MESDNYGIVENIGRLIRILIYNHQKNRAVHKGELWKILNVDSTTRSALLSETRKDLLNGMQSYLKKFDLELIGVCNDGTTTLDKCEKVFLRQFPSENFKKNKLSATHDEKVLFFLCGVLKLENNRLDEKKIEILEKCKLFESVPVVDYLKAFKNQGYFSIETVDEKQIWTYGWRYYVELQGICDIVEYFSSETLKPNV